MVNWPFWETGRTLSRMVLELSGNNVWNNVSSHNLDLDCIEVLPTLMW